MKPMTEATRKRTKTIGDKAEASFEKAVSLTNLKIRKSTRHEDMHHHIDYHVTNLAGQWRAFDVKAYKKSSEAGNILIEWKNVRGKDGWIYGKADFIAFDMKGYFLCVVRHEFGWMQ